MNNLIPAERIENKIYLIRGQKVMIDRDLAELYRVRTKNLNKAVSRNPKRFPSDFMFQLTNGEYEALRFQTGTLKKGQHSKYLPYAFTEQGVAMLSSVLRSHRAIEVNVVIMRTFVKIKRILSSHIEVSRKLKELEGRIDKYDSKINGIFDAIRKMIITEEKPIKIGFNRDKA